MSHELVTQFHRTFQLPIAEGVRPLTYERRALRMNLLAEEFMELCEAQVALPSFAEESYDIEFEFGSLAAVNHLETIDALGDIVYLCFGMAIEMGVNLDHVIAEIHRSNMSKLSRLLGAAR